MNNTFKYIVPKVEKRLASIEENKSLIEEPVAID